MIFAVLKMFFFGTSAMKKKIWIIDDYLPMLDCMRIVLELHDYEVEIAQDGKGLLDKKTRPICY